MRAPERPRLHLVVSPGVAADALASALDGGDVASVEFVEPTPALVALAQGRGVAALVRDDGALARRLGGDGVFLTTPDADIAAARRAVGPDGIVGADAGGSRHSAMAAAEAGADVVGLAAELVPWWAALFLVPGLVRPPASLAAIPALVADGGDFIAVEAAVWHDPAGPRAAIAALNAALDTAWATC